MKELVKRSKKKNESENKCLPFKDIKAALQKVSKDNGHIIYGKSFLKLFVFKSSLLAILQS